MVYKLCDAAREAVLNFVNLYLHGVNLGEKDITFLLFGSESNTTRKVNELSDGNNFSLLIHEMPLYDVWDRGSTVVKVLCYKSEGRWFESRWCHWNFSLTQFFRSHYGLGGDPASNRNEYEEYFLGVKAAGA